MRLQTGANSQAGPAPARDAVERAVPKGSPALRLAVWASVACGAAISLASFSPAFAAESSALLLEMASPAPLLAYASLVAAPSKDTLWSSVHSTATDSVKLDYHAEEAQSNSLLQFQDLPGDLRLQYSLLIDPPKIDSRFSYLTWAAMHTGFGQYYLTDTSPRLRTNGAGIQNPRFLFVKMSFKL